MKQRTITSRLTEHLLNIIKLLPMYLLVITILFFLTFLTEKRFTAALYVYVFLCTALAYLIRYYIRQTFFYYLMHLCMAVPAFVFFHQPIAIVLSMVNLFILMVYAYYYRASDEIQIALCLEPVFVVVCFIAYLITLRSKDHYYSNQYCILTVLFLLISNISAYVKHMQAYVKTNSGNDSIAMKKVVQRNTLIVFGLLFVLFLMAFIGNTSYMRDFIQNILDFIWGVIRKILSALFSNADFSYDEIPEPTPSAFDVKCSLVNKPNWLARLLNTIFMFIVDLACIIIPLFALYLFIRYLLSSMKKPKRTPGESYEGVEETRTRIKRSETKTKHSIFHHKIPHDKIRREYYKTITNYQKHGYQINQTHSPDERTKDIKEQYEEDIQTLTQQYNQARYSKQESK